MTVRGYDGPIAHLGTIVGVIVIRIIKKFAPLRKAFFAEIVHNRDSTDADLRNVLTARQKRSTLLFAAAGTS